MSRSQDAGRMMGWLDKWPGRSFSRSRCWPLIGLFFLFGATFYEMAASPFSFYNDDLIHLFSLHKYINGGFDVAPSGVDIFSALVVLDGIKALYIPVLSFLKAFGAEYPFITASKFWGLAIIPLTFFIWMKYLSRPFGLVPAYWGALAITGYNVTSKIWFVAFTTNGTRCPYRAYPGPNDKTHPSYRAACEHQKELAEAVGNMNGR